MKTAWQLRELKNFISELIHLLSAGLPLLVTLSLLQEHLIHPQEIALAKQLQQQLEKGIPFARAWQSLTQENLSSALLAAGEESGLLVLMLKQVESYAHAQQAFRQLLWQALRYPLFLLSVTIGLLGLLCLWVVPQFASLYANFNVKLPVLTRCIVTFSGNIYGHLLGMSEILGGLMLLGIFCRRHVWMQHTIHRIKQTFPFYRDIEALRFWHAITLLLQAGIPLVPALTLCQKIFFSLQRQHEIRFIIQQLKQGEKLSFILKQQRYFSKKLVAIVALAEASGQLAPMLQAYVLQQTDQLQLKMQTLKTWLEPIFLCGIGGFIGIVLVALYLPIVELGKWV